MTRRTRMQVAWVLFVGAAATAGLAWLSSAVGLLSSSVGDRQTRAGVVEISATTNRVVRQLPLGAPNDVETGLGSTWVTDIQGGRASVAQIRPGLRRRPTAVELARASSTSPDDLAVGQGAVWVAVADALYRLDPARPGAARRIDALGAGGLLSGVAVGAGSVWVADSTRRTLARIDPTSLRTTDVIPLPSSADGVATGGGAVWVPSIQGASVLKVSPNLGRVVRAIHLEGIGNGVASGAGGIWVTAPRRDAVARVDPVSGRVAWIRVGDAPTDVCVSQGAAWVANSGAGTVSRIDASTGEVVATVRVPTRPNRITADADSVWATFLGAP